MAKIITDTDFYEYGANAARNDVQDLIYHFSMGVGNVKEMDKVELSDKLADYAKGILDNCGARVFKSRVFMVPPRKDKIVYTVVDNFINPESFEILVVAYLSKYDVDFTDVETFASFEIHQLAESSLIQWQVLSMLLDPIRKEVLSFITSSMI